MADIASKPSPRIEAMVAEVIANADVIDGHEVGEMTLIFTTGKVWSRVSFTTAPRKPEGET